MATYDIESNVIAQMNNEGKNIITRNDITEELNQALRPINITIRQWQTEPEPVALMHFSDIHGDGDAPARLMTFYDAYSDKLDDMLCTGDIVQYRFSDGIAFWDAVDGAENILVSIGNHDALGATSGFDWSNLKTQAEQYACFMAPYIANWGCAYESGKTYYYKDYTEKNVRLIVLNCMLVDSDKTAQVSWLAATLESARGAGLSVVIAVHYHMGDSVKVQCGFSNIDMRNSETPFGGLDSEYMDAVQTFINAGGEFVCYLAGHLHYDIFSVNATYPTQYCIGIDAASVDQSNYYSDTQRTLGTKSEDLANIVVIDTSSKAVKVIRVGADTDHYLRSKKCMTFKYDTGTILCDR